MTNLILPIQIFRTEEAFRMGDELFSRRQQKSKCLHLKSRDKKKKKRTCEVKIFKTKNKIKAKSLEIALKLRETLLTLAVKNALPVKRLLGKPAVIFIRNARCTCIGLISRPVTINHLIVQYIYMSSIISPATIIDMCMLVS